MILAVTDLHKSYGDHGVLNGVSIDVEPGQRVAVIGRSGSGKSTLLRCINGLEGWDAGSIAFDGQPVDPRRREIRRIREQIGFVFQSFNLFPHLSALDNVALGLRVVRHMKRPDAQARALAALESVGMVEKAHAAPASLSGGQQQRVAIARAMAMEPKLFLFDEPTSALDPELVGEVLEVIRDLAIAGRTMILVTHEMRFARRVADRVVFLDGGRIEADGSPDHVFGSEAPPRVKDFLRQTSHDV